MLWGNYCLVKSTPSPLLQLPFLGIDLLTSQTKRKLNQIKSLSQNHHNPESSDSTETCRPGTLRFSGAQTVARDRNHHIESIRRKTTQLERSKSTHGIPANSGSNSSHFLLLLLSLRMFAQNYQTTWLEKS